MFDPSRVENFALKAGLVVNRCRQLERQVEEEGAHLMTAATRETVRRAGAEPAKRTPQHTHLARLQELAAAVQTLRHALEEMLRGAEDPPVAGDAASRRQARVLVVDDHDDSREAIASALRMAELDVITASNGLEALIAAHNHCPALILMDIQMPILTGLEATRLLKAAMVTRAMPVIAHTARPDACKGDGSNLFAYVLAKPASPEVLVAVVRRFVSIAESRIVRNAPKIQH